ncbi:MAG: hypothetical protein ACFFCD_12225 [Promethearchaeota archaeon]
MSRSLQDYINTLKTTWNKLRNKVEEIKSAMESETVPSDQQSLAALSKELNEHFEYLKNTTQLLNSLIEYTKTLEKRISILEKRLK